MKRITMCRRCGAPRDPASIDREKCPWCKYDPTINAKQRRAEKRAEERKKP